MESLIFLVDKRVKASVVANGSILRLYVPKEEVASPTVSIEISITGVIDSK